MTREQAICFVETLTGFEELTENGDDRGRPMSPHARTFIAATLGYSPTAWQLKRGFANKRVPGITNKDHEAIETMRSFFQDIASALEWDPKDTK